MRRWRWGSASRSASAWAIWWRWRGSWARAEVEDLALAEMLAEGVVLVEWADRAGGALPKPHWRVVIRATGAKSREITVEWVE